MAFQHSRDELDYVNGRNVHWPMESDILSGIVTKFGDKQNKFQSFKGVAKPIITSQFPDGILHMHSVVLFEFCELAVSLLQNYSHVTKL